MSLIFQVRIKPQLSKFEVDLVIDTESENYDRDREEHLQISTQVSLFQYRELFPIIGSIGSTVKLCSCAA